MLRYLALAGVRDLPGHWLEHDHESRSLKLVRPRVATPPKCRGERQQAPGPPTRAGRARWGGSRGTPSAGLSLAGCVPAEPASVSPRRAKRSKTTIEQQEQTSAAVANGLVP